LFFITLLSVFSFNNTVLTENQTDKKNDIIILSNDKAHVGILRRAGGRIVQYKLAGGENVLKSDESLWDYEFNKTLDESIDMTIIPFNGHITWLGPQSEWWSKQNIQKDLRARKSKWPPDPYLIYAECEILDRSDTHIILKNPDSPYSGISLVKKISLLETGEVEIISEITNISDTTISWDIWFNTRLEGSSRFFVPLFSETDYRMEYFPKSFNVIKEEIINGYFTFNHNNEHSNKKIYSSKAFIYPAENKIYAFTGRNMFTIAFEMYDNTDIHPDQALVEIYNRIKPDQDNLLELEQHTKYVELKPGESFAGKIRWSLQEYIGEDNKYDQIEFIKSSAN
jgi:hypothetical protein